MVSLPLPMSLIRCVSGMPVVRLASVTLLLVILPLVALVEATGRPQQARIPAHSLLSHAFRVPADTLKRDDNSAGVLHQHSHPQTAHEIPNYFNHHLALIQRCSWFILASWLIYAKWCQYLAQAQEDRRASQGIAVYRHRNYGVSGGEPVLADDDPVSSEDEVHDARRALISKGRQFSMAAAPNHQCNEPFDELRRNPRLRASDESWILTATSQSVISDDHDQSGDTNATNVNGPVSSSSHALSATAQAYPRSEPPIDLPCAPVGSRLYFADSTTKRAFSVPMPGVSRVNHSRTPSRNESLPHDPNYERTPPRSTKIAPLKSGLYVGSADLAAPPETQWFILFIEVDDKQGPECNPFERNLHCFQEMFKLPTTESTSIYFDFLAGTRATPDNIKAKLTSLYLRAGCVCDDSMVLVFLTGTGDESNRMRLLNDEVVTEANLRDWISDVRTQSRLTNVQTVPIIFDICRVNKKIPSVGICQLVELMWSCSLGQQAHAVGFPGVPNSCFLLALLWAAYGVFHSGFLDFEESFRFRLGQLVRIRRYSHDYWLHELGECEECGVGSQCTPPGPQDPEGQQAGWDVVASLGTLIMARYPEYVHNVVTVLTGEMQRCEMWERASSLVKEEHRGATQHVAAGSARNVDS